MTDAASRFPESADTPDKVIRKHLFTLYPGEIACDCEWTVKDESESRLLDLWSYHLASVLADLAIRPGDEASFGTPPKHTLLGNICSCGDWSPGCGNDIPEQWRQHVNAAERMSNCPGNSNSKPDLEQLGGEGRG